ncbi:MAG: alpha/beta hydrolase [Acidobacteriota bacterium]
MFLAWFFYTLLAFAVVGLLPWFLVARWLRGPDLSAFDEPSSRRVTTRTEASPEIAKVHGILANLRKKTGPVGSRGRIHRVREAFDEGFSDTPRDPESLGVEIRDASAGGVPAEWVLAPGHDPRRRLLYVHGGAFYVGSPKSHRPLTAALARRTGAAVLSIDYRLLPESSRRDGIEDCQTAYRWVLEHGPDGPLALDGLFVAGDSAGGNLTLMLTAWARDEDLRPVDAALALSPATDSSATSPTITRNLATDVMLGPVFKPLLRFPRSLLRLGTLFGLRIHPCNPLISPVHGNLAGLPPTLVQASESELLLGDASRYVNKAQAAGSPVELQTWPGMVHVWQIFEGVVPEASEALDQMAEFVRRNAREDVGAEALRRRPG